jgi:hypothetical protein
VKGICGRQPDLDFLSGRIIPDGTPDLAVLERAANDDRVLVSHDRKTMPRAFRELVAVRYSPGLVLIPQALPIGAAIEELEILWLCTKEQDLANRIIYLPL